MSQVDPIRVAAFSRGTWFEIITAQKSGITYGAAIMAADVTPERLTELWAKAPHPVVVHLPSDDELLPDIVDMALSMLVPGRKLRFAAMPLPPDQLYQDRGAEALRKALSASKGLAEALWLTCTKASSLASPDDLAAIQAEIGDCIGLIPDEGVRQAYWQDARQRIGPFKRPSPIVRSNGTSHHSAVPGAIKLKRGLDSVRGFSIKEAALVAEMVKRPELVDVEHLPQVSERTAHVLAEIINLIGSVPSEELEAALKGAKVWVDVEEARTVLKSAGIRSLS